MVLNVMGANPNGIIKPSVSPFQKPHHHIPGLLMVKRMASSCPLQNCLLQDTKSEIYKMVKNLSLCVTYKDTKPVSITSEVPSV